MNQDDYDEDGNNIVPCPICLSAHCPSKEDGKCPEEDMFALEGEIRLLLAEYKATGDNSRIANVLEFVENWHTQTLTDIEAECAKEKENALTSQKNEIREKINEKIKNYVEEGDTHSADVLIDLCDILALLDNKEI